MKRVAKSTSCNAVARNWNKYFVKRVIKMREVGWTYQRLILNVPWRLHGGLNVEESLIRISLRTSQGGGTWKHLSLHVGDAARASDVPVCPMVFYSGSIRDWSSKNRHSSHSKPPSCELTRSDSDIPMLTRCARTSMLYWSWIARIYHLSPLLRRDITFIRRVFCAKSFEIFLYRKRNNERAPAFDHVRTVLESWQR